MKNMVALLTLAVLPQISANAEQTNNNRLTVSVTNAETIGDSRDLSIHANAGFTYTPQENRLSYGNYWTEKYPSEGGKIIDNEGYITADRDIFHSFPNFSYINGDSIFNEDSVSRSIHLDNLIYKIYGEALWSSKNKPIVGLLILTLFRTSILGLNDDNLAFMTIPYRVVSKLDGTTKIAFLDPENLSRVINNPDGSFSRTFTIDISEKTRRVRATIRVQVGPQK